MANGFLICGIDEVYINLKGVVNKGLISRLPISGIW